MRAIKETPEHDAIVCAAEYAGIEPRRFQAALEMWKMQPGAAMPDHAAALARVKEISEDYVEERNMLYARIAQLEAQKPCAGVSEAKLVRIIADVQRQHAADIMNCHINDIEPYPYNDPQEAQLRIARALIAHGVISHQKGK